MERLINRLCLQLCSRCSRDILRNLRSSSTGLGLGRSATMSTCNSDHLLLRSSCIQTQGMRRYTTGWGILKYGATPLSLQKTYLASIRSFATDPAQSEEKPIPNPLPPRKTKHKDPENASPITWKTLVIFGGVASLLVLAMKYIKSEKEEAQRKAQNKKMGKAKLGGEWTLTNHNGKVQSSWDFRGQWLLIYFGFTNCPDICPEEIEKIVSVLEKTDADSDLPKIQPIVITVDPDRDTPEALKEYCGEFSPRLLGFSGSQEQIQAATRAYRVYFSAGPKDEDNDYIVDHSIISYLVNPEGEFVDYFGQNKKVEEIYGSVKLHIHSYLKKKKNSES